MELHVENFRKLHDRTFVFKEGVNLLRGSNGKGKSTLLACIEWVLYGSCQGGSPLPWGQKKAGATLVFGDKGLKIHRRKGPEFFVVERDGVQYKDKEGDELVAGYFGPAEVWRATCFVPQLSFCPLLAGTKEQQISTLNTLIFENKDPAVIQKKIDLKRKEEEQEVKMLRGKIEGLMQGLDLFEAAEYSLGEIKILIMILQEETKKVMEHEKVRVENQARWDVFKDRLVKVEAKIEAWKDKVADERQIGEWKKELETQKDRFRTVQAYKKIKGRIEELESTREELLSKVKGLDGNEKEGRDRVLDEKGREYEKETYEKLKAENELYRKNLNICIHAEVDFEEKAIEAKKVELRRTIDHLAVAKEIRGKKREIGVLREKMGSYGNENKYAADLSVLEERIRNQIYLYKKNQDIMACPNCQAALRFDQSSQSKLVPSDGFVVDQSKLDDLIAELENIRVYQERRREIQGLSQRIEEKKADIDRLGDLLDEKDLNGYFEQSDIEELNRTLYLLGRVEIAEKPEDDVSYLIQYKIQEIDKELAMWKTDLVEGESWTEQEIQDMEDRIKDKELLLILYKGALDEKVYIEGELAGLKVGENQSERLEKCKAQLEALAVQKEKAELVERMQGKKEVLKGFEVTKGEKEDRIAALETLKDICKRVQSDRIDASLFALNKTSNQILESMFEEPITVELKATKETKQGKTRNELAITIVKNNEVIKTLRPGLSVGEANRVSMAISLALWLQTPSSFMILDEPFAPVDREMIDLSFKAIQNTVPKGRFVIISAPNNLGGDFNHEVRLN